MITVISGTNRRSSQTIGVARHYYQRLKELATEPVNLYSLEDLPSDVLHSGMYDGDGQSQALREVQESIIIPADKWVFVFPEYNGGMPGVLKVFIDACSVHRYHDTWKRKKACLAGISSGRAGNLRGMEHLTGILNYLGVTVMPNKLPISSIEKMVDEQGQIHDLPTLEVIDKQLKQFLDY